MRFFRLSAFLCCAWIVPAASAQATGSVSGHVLCTDTHTPCRFATVALQPVASVVHATQKSGTQQRIHSRSYGGVTGIDGAYQIDGVAPGDYYVLASLPGYLNPYDQLLSELPDNTSPTEDVLDKALPRVSVAPNRPSSADLTLNRGSSLSGTVLFDDGGAANGVSIELLLKDKSGTWKRYTNRAGDEAFSAIGFASHTDDRGHFYEPGLPSGTYAVEARLQEIFFIPTSITHSNSGATISDQRQNALRIFYGDKFRLKEAKPIELGDGEDRTDIDITIPTTGLYSVRASVSAKNGDAVSRGTVELSDPDDKTVLRTTDIQPDGSFSFNDLPGGTYVIHIQPANKETEFQPLTSTLLVNNDLLGLTYTVAPKGSSSGANQ